MLCILWNFRGVIYFKLFPTYQTITSKVYCHQFDRLNQTLIQKEPILVRMKIVIFQNDNAQLIVTRITVEKLKQFGWEVLPHPPYFPDVELSDYFISLVTKFFQRKKFHNKEALKSNAFIYLFIFFSVYAGRTLQTRDK